MRPSKSLSGVAFWLLSGSALVFLAAFIVTLLMWTNSQSELLANKKVISDLSERSQTLERQAASLSNMVAEKQQTIDAMREDWKNEIQRMEEQHSSQLATQLDRMNQIVHNGAETLTYINEIEERLQSGQSIQRQEVNDLIAVVKGLEQLKQQYQKPLNEFRLLDSYFSRQVKASGPRVETASLIDPKESSSLGRKLFQNRKYKAEREAYFEAKAQAQATAAANAARKSAYSNARSQVKSAYSRAQAQMKAIQLDTAPFLATLESMIDGKVEQTADTERFFKESRKVIEVHEELLKKAPQQPARP